MRHKKLGRRFGRQSAHRQAMFSNMAASLIRHEQIVTTLPKAKDLKRVIDKYITLGKRGDLNSRRLAAARLGDEDMVKKLFDVAGAPLQGSRRRLLARASRRASATATAHRAPSSSSSIATSSVKGAEDKARHAEEVKAAEANA